MAEKTTARWALPYPTETGNVKVGPTDFEELAQRIDEILFEPGDLRFTAKATIDATRWLVCEGQAVSRTTYKALFEAIGTAYGEGDKSTTFNVPDYRERVPIGASGASPRGSKGGEHDHVLSVAEIPTHSHSTHIGYSEPGSHIGGAILMRDNFVLFGEADITTSTAGSGHAHNNMQPYSVCNVWIKT
jgi:microcystin-dependent protein